MRPETKIVLTLGLALLLCGSHGLRLPQVNNKVAVFDVTNFGAKADGEQDNNMAFKKAWIKACNTEGLSKVVIPPGNYMAGEVMWTGPCKGYVAVEVQGTVCANKDISEFSNGYWFSIENVDGFEIHGVNFKGTFNGNGNTSWEHDTCTNPDGCDVPPLPPSFSLSGVKNGDIGFLSSIDSRGYHFKIKDSSDVHLHNLNIEAPYSSPHTNGVEVTSSNNIQVTHCTINTGGGKNCVIWGPGSINNVYHNVLCNVGHWSH